MKLNKKIILFILIGCTLISFYPAQARRMKTILVINPDNAILIESFTQLIKNHFQGKNSISGIDLGAGNGRKTRQVQEVLSQIFGSSNVDYSGIDIVYQVRREGNSVTRMDVRDAMNNPALKNLDLITIFAPEGLDLKLFVQAAKQMINKDGLIIIVPYSAEMQSLFNGRYMGFVPSEKISAILSDFTLVRFDNSDGLPKGNIPQGPFAFVYSPNDSR